MDEIKRKADKSTYEKFGFKLYTPASGKSFNADRDYLIYTPARDGNYRCLRLSMCKETGNFVSMMVGDTVDVYATDDGVILLSEGDGAKVTESYVNGKKSSTERRMVSITGLTDLMFDAYGPFKRLYLQVKPFGYGGGVLFVPTGEKDELGDES